MKANLHQPFAGEYDLSDFGDARHPGVANQLWIERQYPSGSSGYRLEEVFHSSKQRVPSSLPMASTPVQSPSLGSRQENRETGETGLPVM